MAKTDRPELVFHGRSRATPRRGEHEHPPSTKPESPPRTLTRDEVRELMRQGEAIGRELEARFERMERDDPKSAATRAR